MLIFDAHLDLAWNALDWNRDLRLPVADLRRREREQGMSEKGRGVNTVSFRSWPVRTFNTRPALIATTADWRGGVCMDKPVSHVSSTIRYGFIFQDSAATAAISALI